MHIKNLIVISAALILGTYFLITGVVEAASFLIPFTIALLITLISIPLVRKLEKWKVPSGIASLTAVILSLLAFLSFFAIISVQVAQLADSWPEIEEQMKPKVTSVQEFARETLGMEIEALQVFSGESEIQASEGEEDSTSENQKSGPGESAAAKESSSTEQIPGMDKLGTLVTGFFGFLGSSLLVFIYQFFLIHYRRKIKKSILNFFKEEDRESVKRVFQNAIQLSLNFLNGRLLLILFLAVIYSIGIAASGVENAILISVIAAVLSLLPFVGVILGYVLAIGMTAFSGGDTVAFIGVSITYSVAQFIETYILEPYLVGRKVSINPLMTVLAVVIGGSLWGVAGMVLSIPIAGIIKIICDAATPLQPVGYLLGEEDVQENSKPGIFQRWGKKLKKKLFSS